MAGCAPCRRRGHGPVGGSHPRQGAEDRRLRRMCGGTDRGVLQRHRAVRPGPAAPVGERPAGCAGAGHRRRARCRRAGRVRSLGHAVRAQPNRRFAFPGGVRGGCRCGPGCRRPGGCAGGAAVSAVWCEAAWLPGRGVVDSVRAEVDEAGIVTSVRAGVPAAAADLQVAGVAFPAAANAHSHAFHRVLRGRTHNLGVGSFWTWREQMYKAAGTLTPDLYEELATAVFAEMVVTGWTSVAEFHY